MRCVSARARSTRARLRALRLHYPPACSLAQAALSSPSAGAAGCRAYVVPLQSSALVAELGAVARFAASAGAQRHHAFVLTSEASPLSAAAAAERRQLQSTQLYAATGSIRMQPEILAGLVISLFLASVVLIGVQCTMAVKTPDVMHSFSLPAGREY
jgi:hypothetical protein